MEVIEMEIKNKIWIVELKEKRFLFNDEKEAINEWKNLAKNEEPKLSEIMFTKDGIEYGAVSWSKIALQLAKGDLK